MSFEFFSFDYVHWSLLTDAFYSEWVCSLANDIVMPHDLSTVRQSYFHLQISWLMVYFEIFVRSKFWWPWFPVLNKVRDNFLFESWFLFLFWRVWDFKSTVDYDVNLRSLWILLANNIVVNVITDCVACHELLAMIMSEPRIHRKRQKEISLLV